MKMWNGIYNIIMNFPLSNKLCRLWRNADWHWLILTHPYEDSFLPQQQFGVIHHCAYFVGSLVFKKYHNVYLPTFSLFFSTFARQPLNHVLKQYQESGHYCSYLLHSEWASSPTKSLYVELHQKGGRMQSLPSVSSLSNKNLTAYLLPKVTLWELRDSVLYTKGPRRSLAHLAHWVISIQTSALAVDLRWPMNWLQPLLDTIWEPLENNNLDNHL